MGVIVGRAEHLAAGDIFIDRRDTALKAHTGGVDRLADRQPLQGGAISAQQKNRFDAVAAGLLQRQRRQLPVGDAAFGHDPVHRQIKLLANLINADFRKPSLASAFLFL